MELTIQSSVSQNVKTTLAWQAARGRQRVAEKRGAVVFGTFAPLGAGVWAICLIASDGAAIAMALP